MTDVLNGNDIGKNDPFTFLCSNGGLTIYLFVYRLYSVSMQYSYVMDVHGCESRECNAIFRQFNRFIKNKNKNSDLDNDRKRKLNTMNFRCSPGITRIRDDRRFGGLFFFVCPNFFQFPIRRV